MHIYIDIEPHEDRRLLVERKFTELARGLTGFCYFCRATTTHIVIWEPESEQHKLAAKVPRGKTRVFFFPVCRSCSDRDCAEEELQWRTIESLNVNVPVDDCYRWLN